MKYKAKTASTVPFRDVVSVIKSKDTTDLKALLNNKHIELIDEKLETVIHAAARLGDIDVIQTLLEDRRVARLLDSEMYNGDTPLVLAAKSNNVGAVQILADHGADVWRQKLQSENTILHFSASLHDSELLQTLLKRNPPSRVMYKANEFGETALDVAVMTNSPNIQVMIEAGVDYSKSNKLTGRNLLHTSIAYNQCEVLRNLLELPNSNKLANQTDKRGDTPLMLAIKTACIECVKILIKYVKVDKDFNDITGESLLHMAVRTDRSDILAVVLMFSHEHVISYQDFEGRTPLHLSVECKKNQCLKRLMNTQNIYEKNGITNETVLHTAVRVKNAEALTLFMNSKNSFGTWCFSQQDRDGKTPFWLAVESDNAQMVGEARKLGWVDIDKLNLQGDSCMYVAAACGHLNVLKTLLLSDKFYSFCRTYDKSPDFKGKALVKEAEISCDIYSSDIFILTDEIGEKTSHSWFPKTFLNFNIKNNRNIFHACAIGGNILCLEFLYTFVKTFSVNDLPSFDFPDIFGNTPLHLATRNDLGGPHCVYYLLSQRADIYSHNKKGDFVLESILRNTEHSTDIINHLLDKGIVYNQETRGLQEESASTVLFFDFSILRPSGSIMKVISLFYDKVQGEQRQKLLEHQLFKMYVNLVLANVNYFFTARFLLSCFCTLLLSIYIIFYCHAPLETPIIQFTRHSLTFFNLLCLLFSVPIFLNNELNIAGILTTVLLVLPCVLVLGLTIIPHGSNLSFEIAAVSVLFTFFSLNMYLTTLFKTISHQVAMLTHVVYGILKYSGTVFFVLWAFSLAFYCIFNNSFYFVSPFKSFIYTTYVLLLADMSDSYNFFQAKHFSYNTTNSDGSTKTGPETFASHLDLYFESTIILVFIIMVNLALINMLVSLAVRDGKTLETSGSIFQRHLQIRWLSNLELFLDSSFCRLIMQTPIIYLFGIIPSKTIFQVGTIYYPLMYEKSKNVYPQTSLRELKRTLARTKRFQTSDPRINLEAIDRMMLARTSV